MGRLIDAGKIRYTWFGKADGTHSDGVTLQSIVHETPTAYDVEAVVKEVQDIGTRFCTTIHCNNECENCDHGSIMKAVIDAIRKGGVK